MPQYRLSYLSQLRESNRVPCHLVSAFHADLQRQLGMDVPVLQPHGDLHLSDQQKESRPLPDPYWYLVAGGKLQIAAKIWTRSRFQRTVDLLHRRGIQIVQGGTQHPEHLHFSLSGVVNTVGQTSLRDVLWWIRHAEGVICPPTFAMHVAAAFEKPCRS